MTYKVNLERFFFIVLFFGFVLLPFIFWPSAPVPYEIPRVWFVLAWIDLLVVIEILLRIFRKSHPMPRPLKIHGTIFLYMIVFVAVAIVASIIGSDWNKSAFGNYYRRDGLVTLVHVVSFSGILSIVWRSWWRKPIAWGIALGSIGTSAWVTLVATQVWNGGIGVSFGQEKFAAGYFLVTLPFIYYILRTQTNIYAKFLLLAGFLTQIVAIAFTRSWAAGSGIVIFFGLLIFFETRNTIIRKIFMSASVLVAIAIMSLKWVSIGSVQPQLLAESRQRIFMKGMLAFAKRPILGWGWANFDYAFGSIDWPYHFSHDAYVDKAHAELLEILVTTGIFGFGTYLLLLGKTGRLMYGKWNQAKGSDKQWFQTLIMVFLLYLFHAQTNVISIGEGVFFWFLLGVVGSDL